MKSLDRSQRLSYPERRARSVFSVFYIAVICLLVAVAAGAARANEDANPPNPRGPNPHPQDAAKAILAAFDKYEFVAMPHGHGNKDVDDFILDLIRNPAFPAKVNDIVYEGGNSRYQPVLDRYIAGEDVPLAELRHVWRDSTQPATGQGAT